MTSKAVCRPKEEQYSDALIRLFGWKYPNKKTIEVTFQVTEGCTLCCTYCVLPNTLVTLENGTQKPISQIGVGEKVLGFEEKTENRKQRRLKSSIVEKVFKREIDEDVYEITMATGDTINITGNHKILSRGNRWKLPSNLKIGDEISCSSVNLTTDPIGSVEQYEKGYLIGMFLGDGSIKQYYYEDRGSCHKIRLALKDAEPIQYCAEILKKNDIDFYFKPFLISKLENLYTDAIFANSLDSYNKLTKLIKDNFGINTNIDYYKGFLAGIYDAEGHIDRDSNIIRICNTDEKIIDEIKKGSELLELPYTTEERPGTNKPVYVVRYLSDNNQKKSPIAFKFYRKVAPKITRKAPHFIDKTYLKCQEVTRIKKYHYSGEVYNLQTSTSTYIANNLLVHNCYQHAKSPKVMALATGKQYIDKIFETYKDTHFAIILEFIGGEPLLQPQLIMDLVDYWDYKCIMEKPEWGALTRISICSNGTEYDKPLVQKLLNRFKHRLSFTVSIDGDKELHDSARIHPDGRGSYDEAIHAATSYEKTYSVDLGSKVTIAPSNLIFLHGAIEHYLEQGKTIIYANTVYEKGWTVEHARLYYQELKKIIDYILEHDMEDRYISLFEEDFFCPQDEDDLGVWCGGDGSMLACDPDGILYPCLRYAPSSVGRDKEAITCGDIQNGIDTNVLNAMKTINRRTMSTDKCFYCPIAKGCSYCIAYNWEMTGSINKRTTYSCQMHQARALANVYYWNNVYKKYNIKKRFYNNVPDDWALEIISKDELKMLNELSLGNEA